MSGNSEAKSLLDELRFDKGDFFNLGHPLLNWTAQSFVKTAGVCNVISHRQYFGPSISPNQFFVMGVGVQIGALQAIAREACHIAFEGKRNCLYFFILFG